MAGLLLYDRRDQANYAATEDELEALALLRFVALLRVHAVPQGERISARLLPPPPRFCRLASRIAPAVAAPGPRAGAGDDEDEEEARDGDGGEERRRLRLPRRAMQPQAAQQFGQVCGCWLFVIL